MNRRWICNDVLMDIFPFFDHAQLGLKLALLSPRFDALVNTHFDGKTALTIWRATRISKELAGPKATLSVWIDGNYVDFPLPDRPLPNKIRFKYIRIEYIDYSVIKFLRSNQQICNRGSNLYLNFRSSKTESNAQPIWDVFVRQIWPVFTTTNLHHLSFKNSAHDNLLRLTSPTVLTDLKQLHSIDSFGVLPDAINNYLESPNLEWINSFKEPFELVNERTKEKLTLEKVSYGGGDEFFNDWQLKRCPISEKAATDQWEKDGNWDDNLNNVQFNLWGGKSSTGPCRNKWTKKKKKRVKASKRRLIARK